MDPIEARTIEEAVCRVVESLPRPAVFVVDDDEGRRARLSAWVEAAGFRAVSLDGGRACLAALAAERPVAVILDLELRGLGGFATLDFIRTVEPDLPVVALAGARERGRAADLLERGASELLLKPAGQDRLSRALSAVLRPAPATDRA